VAAEVPIAVFRAELNLFELSAPPVIFHRARWPSGDHGSDVLEVFGVEACIRKQREESGSIKWLQFELIVMAGALQPCGDF
jgi:hypothetical protein